MVGTYPCTEHSQCPIRCCVDRDRQLKLDMTIIESIFDKIHKQLIARLDIARGRKDCSSGELAHMHRIFSQQLETVFNLLSDQQI